MIIDIIAFLPDDFVARHRPLVKPKLPNHFRRAMDKKHQEERRIMELAIVEIMKKEVEDD